MNAEVQPDLLAQPAAKPEPPPFVAGVFEDMPNDLYHSFEALSSSGAKTIINRSLRHYRYERDNPKPQTDAMRLGTITHTAILEPEKLDGSVIVVRDKIDKRTNAGKAAWAAIEAEADATGKLIVSGDDFDRVRRMVDAVHRHQGAMRLLEGSKREVSLFWNDPTTGAELRVRFDIQKWIDESNFFIADVKTCEDASPEGFGRAIASYGYHLSGAMYLLGGETVYSRTPLGFVFIAVESSPPHGVAVYALQPNHVLAGMQKIDRAIRLYAEARATDYWPAYSPLIEAATMPGWALKQAA